MKHKTKYEVRILADITPQPNNQEISAAKLISQYFCADVNFVKRTIHKTANFQIGRTLWELKSPRGDGKRTIQHALQSALAQSPYIIVDARQSKNAYQQNAS